MTDQKNAIVLSGGGALAAYEVGVLKALLNGQSPATQFKPLHFDIVTGTSAGCVNSSLLLTVSHESPATVAGYLERVWLQEIAAAPGKCGSGAFRLRADPLDFIRPACYTGNPIAPFVKFAADSAVITQNALTRGANFLFSSEDLEERILELVDVSVFLAAGPLKETLHRTVNLERLRNSEKILRVASTNWKLGIVQIFTNADMTDERGYQIILASAAIPGVYPAVELDGVPHVDGGVVMNTPLAPAIQAGANSLHVVYMNPEAATVPLPRLPNTVNDVARTFLIAIGHNVNQNIRIAEASGAPLSIHRYHPYGEIGWGLMNFRRELLEELIQRGFADAVNHDCRRNRCLFPS